MSTQRSENWPKRLIRTLSPAASVLVDRRFPAARARRREDEDAAVLRLEDLLQVLEQRQRELGKSASACPPSARSSPADRIGNVGRAGNEKVRLHLVVVMCVSSRVRASVFLPNLNVLADQRQPKRSLLRAILDIAVAVSALSFRKIEM